MGGELGADSRRVRRLLSTAQRYSRECRSLRAQLADVESELENVRVERNASDELLDAAMRMLEERRTRPA